jgi:hypothetical protein
VVVGWFDLKYFKILFFIFGLTMFVTVEHDYYYYKFDTNILKKNNYRLPNGQENQAATA